MGLPLVVGFKNLPPHQPLRLSPRLPLWKAKQWETRRRDNVENDKNINFKTLPRARNFKFWIF